MDGLPFFPPEASTLAPRVDALFFFLLGSTVLIAGGVFVAIILFCIKYRRRPGNEIARRVGGTTPIEITWTLIPTCLAMVPFVWGAVLYLDSFQPPADAEEVYVVAKQWMWKAEHIGGQSEIDELHVPVGRPIKLTLTSQDVIHSFFVPEFRIKTDVLPGRYTTVWFQATRAGEFHLFCAEYCGTNHSRMLGRIIAMEPTAFAGWLSGGPVESPAAAGRQIFAQYGCVSCHETGIAPNLQGVFGRPVQLQNGQTVLADEAYIRESILNPTAKVVAGYQPIMPSFAGQLSDDQIIRLIAYIKSLGAPPAQAPSEPEPVPPAVPTGGAPS